MKVAYITVSTTDGNRKTSEQNIVDIISMVQDGYEIISASGDGAGSVHYVLMKPEGGGLPFHPSPESLNENEL